MKTPEIIQIEYRLGDKVRQISLKNMNTGVEKIISTGPGMAEILHSDGLIDVIVSDQMVLTAKVDTSKIEMIDMDVARVS